MTTKRVTISIPASVVSKAQRAVDSGHAASISGYFAALAEREPDWADAGAALDAMIREAGGLSEDALAWARDVLRPDDAQARSGVA